MPDRTAIAIQRPTPRRRMLLGLAAGAAAAATATRLVSPPAAEAADLVLGANNNATPKRTHLRSDRDGISLLLENRGGSDTRVTLAAWAGEGAIPTPQGDSAAILAVASTTNSGFAFVRGVHAKALGGANSAGVLGEADAGTGVAGISQSGTGVSAKSTSGTALDVVGTSKFSGPAVFGLTVSALGFSGGGSSLTALNASNLSSGTVSEGRLPVNIPRKNASSNSFSGIVRALSFGGLGMNAPAFTSSGSATIVAGKTAITIVNPAATQATKVIATLQGSPGEGITLSHIERNVGRFRVVLTGKTTESTTVAYFILR